MHFMPQCRPLCSSFLNLCLYFLTSKGKVQRDIERKFASEFQNNYISISFMISFFLVLQKEKQRKGKGRRGQGEGQVEGKVFRFSYLLAIFEKYGVKKLSEHIFCY